MRRHHSRQPLATSDSACTKYVGKWIAGPHLLSSQCCEEAPDALHRKLQSEPGPCLAGSRMLVSAASHTPAGSRDHRSWHYLRVVVDNLWQVRQTMGVAVDLIVAVTAKPPRLITSAPGWQLVKSAKLFPPGVYNRLVVHFNMYVQLAVAAQEYDWYLILENDLNITASQLEGLCHENVRLAGTRLMPGLLRVEYNGKRESLLDLLHRGGKCSAGVILHRGRGYAIPQSPYAAYWFLPAHRLACILAHVLQQGRKWLYHMARLSTSGCHDCERFSGSWTSHWLQTVVPLDSPSLGPRPFIHHMSDKYASLPGGGPSTCSADRWLRDNSQQQQQRTFNAQPVPLPPLAVAPRNEAGRRVDDLRRPKTGWARNFSALLMAAGGSQWLQRFCEPICHHMGETI